MHGMCFCVKQCNGLQQHRLLAFRGWWARRCNDGIMVEHLEWPHYGRTTVQDGGINAFTTLLLTLYCWGKSFQKNVCAACPPEQEQLAREKWVYGTSCVEAMAQVICTPITINIAKECVGGHEIALVDCRLGKPWLRICKHSSQRTLLLPVLSCEHFPKFSFLLNFLHSQLPIIDPTMRIEMYDFSLTTPCHMN